MSVQANLVLNDGQSTPVAKTFSARGADMKSALWTDVSSGLRIGNPLITILNSESTGSNGAYRVVMRVKLPVLEVVSGDAGGYQAVPKVAFEMFGKVELTSPNRASLQNRKDLFAFVKNLMGASVGYETFVDFDPAN